MTRFEAGISSLSWIPMGAITGALHVPFDMGIAHYDQPPPDALASLDAVEELRHDDRFRFFNDHRAYVDVEDGRITGYGYLGTGRIGITRLKIAGKGVTFAAVAYPDLRREPEVGENFVTFVQTTGGRTGVPMPRAVKRAPFVQIAAPTAWTSLSLTIFADGTSKHEIVGASPFPRHWFYDDDGKLTEKSATIDFAEWSSKSFGKYSPWGDENSPALITAVESAVEHELSAIIIDASPRFRKLKAGEVLVEQGAAGNEVFLLFDGVLSVEKDGEAITEFGPGAILGEMAVVGDGKRVATLRAVTDCRIASVNGDNIERSALQEIADSRE
jgi:hypothetical protein